MMYLCVMYDISSRRRLQKIARLCTQRGLSRIQKSVFLGKLDTEELVGFRDAALRILVLKEDRLLMLPLDRACLKRSVDLGRSSGIREMLEERPLLFV